MPSKYPNFMTDFLMFVVYSISQRLSGQNASQQGLDNFLPVFKLSEVSLIVNIDNESKVDVKFSEGISLPEFQDCLQKTQAILNIDSIITFFPKYVSLLF